MEVDEVLCRISCINVFLKDTLDLIKKIKKKPVERTILQPWNTKVFLCNYNCSLVLTYYDSVITWSPTNFQTIH